MGVRARRPKLFKGDSPKRASRRTIDGMRADILDKLQATAQRVDDVYVKRMPNYLEVTEKQLEKQGVIDLKKAFASSSKRKKTKDGGWYLVVPIRIKSSRLSRKAYQDLRRLEVPDGKSHTTTITDYLEAVSNKNITHKALQPQSPSGNTTKYRKKGNKNANYFIFRTVSSKSPANSWILNRDKVNDNNFSKTTLKNVRRLMDWKMKNMR